MRIFCKLDFLGGKKKIMKLARDSVDNNEIYAINAEAPKVTY